MIIKYEIVPHGHSKRFLEHVSSYKIKFYEARFPRLRTANKSRRLSWHRQKSVCLAFVFCSGGQHKNKLLPKKIKTLAHVQNLMRDDFEGLRSDEPPARDVAWQAVIYFERIIPALIVAIVGANCCSNQQLSCLGVNVETTDRAEPLSLVLLESNI